MDNVRGLVAFPLVANANDGSFFDDVVLCNVQIVAYAP
jgi:hypothetical protein